MSDSHGANPRGRVLGVSVVVLTHNEEDKIGNCLKALLKQIPSGIVEEILVVDNHSTDQTCGVVKQICTENPHVSIRLLEHEVNNLGAARAKGIVAAKSSLVAFIDADCIAAPNWLNTLCRGFKGLSSENPNLGGVGGDNRPPWGFNSFYDCLYMMRKSFFGHLNSPQARPYAQAKPVDHIPTTNALYDKESVLAVGNFCSDFESVCEDVELGFRLRRSVRQLYMLPNATVVHYSDSTWNTWCRRIYRFGWGQFEVMKRHPRYWCLRLTLPLAFIIAFLLTPIFAVLSWWALVLPAFYFIFIASMSLYLCYRYRRLQLTLKLLALFVCTHFAYSVGEFTGLIGYLRSPQRTSSLMTSR